MESVPKPVSVRLPKIEAPREAAPQIILVNWGAGVRNPGFTEVLHSGTSFWSVEPGPGSSEIGKGKDGDPAMVLPGNYYYNTATQEAAFSEPVNGHVLTLTADCFAAEPGTAKVGLMLSPELRYFSGEHPGDSTWQMLSVVIDVPQDSPAVTSATILLSHFNKPKSAVVFDNVSLTIDTR